MLRLQVTGIIGQDAVVRDVNSFKAISFSVAHTHKWVQGTETKERTVWISCTLWRKPGKDGIAQYLKKGTRVYVEGEPSARAYASRQDNSAQAVLELRVDGLDLMSPAKPQAAAATPTPHPSQPNPPAGGGAPAYEVVDTFNVGKVDDDLPF